jgi:hypothetical protein
MQLVGTIAVVASVLGLAYQVRLLTRQTRISNLVAQIHADQGIVDLSTRISGVFIRHPELRAEFFDQLPEPSSTTEVRLMTVADQYADLLQIALETADKLKPYGWTTDDITAWAGSMVETSRSFRSIIRDNPGLWPPLEPFVAAYDASHAAPEV